MPCEEARYFRFQEANGGSKTPRSLIAFRSLSYPATQPSKALLPTPFPRVSRASLRMSIYVGSSVKFFRVCRERRGRAKRGRLLYIGRHLCRRTARSRKSLPAIAVFHPKAQMMSSDPISAVSFATLAVPLDRYLSPSCVVVP